MLDLNEICHQNGLRLTKQRENIINILKGQPKDVLNIIKLLKQKNFNVDKVTVYRTLLRFCAMGIVVKTYLDDQSAVYELSSEIHHHHMVCANCGKVRNIPINDNYLISRITRKTGFIINNHYMEFFGLCPKCQKIHS